MRSGSRFNVKPPLGAWLGGPLSQGLVGAWIFNECGGLVQRDLVRGYTGTMSTSAGSLPTWSADPWGTTYFANTDDGSSTNAINNSYFQVDSDYAPLKPTGSVSVAVCYKLRHTPRNSGNWGGAYCLVSKGGNTNGIIFDLYTVTGPGPRWAPSIGGSFRVVQGTSAQTPNNNSAAIGADVAALGTYNKGTGVANLYVKGILCATLTPGTAGVDDNTSAYQFGARTASTAPGFFDGWMRYVYIWNREVTASEAAMISLDPYAPVRRYRIGASAIAVPTLAEYRRTISEYGTRAGSRQRNRS